MIAKALRLFCLLTCFALSAFAQPAPPAETGNGEDTVLVNSLLQQSKDLGSDDPKQGISIAIKARDVARRIKFLKGQAYSHKQIGFGYYYLGNYVETLNEWHQGLAIFEEIKDDIGVANLLNNIAAIYTEQGNDEKGLEYALRSLTLSEKTGDKLRILSALNTVGSIYYKKPATWDKALGYLLRALPLCEAIGNKEALGIISENIGDIYFYKTDKNDKNNKDNDAKAVTYFKRAIENLGNAPNSAFAYNGLGKVYLKQGDIKQALTYHEKALDISEKLNSKINIIRSLNGIALVYVNQNDLATSMKYYLQAVATAEEIKASPDLKALYQEMAIVYSKNQDYKNAFKYQTLYADLKDTLYNIETDKKLGRLQFDFDIQKKEGEINLLTKDKALNELQIRKQRLVKNAFAGGLALVLLIAVILFKNYRAKVKTNRILDKQKAQIEDLLLNILPSEVAKELQVKGQATPRNYETVSVMFTDFKNFTTHADKLSPQKLVEELNSCFIAFDEIIGKYNLEKIKTIGDSYMCAGGIPTPDDKQAYNIVNASLEIQDWILLNNKRRNEEGLESWDLRIGIHVGPVVAGVVGKKKYAYDIWGSTVNIASRMESNGAPGQVNISSSTYELVKDKFHCSHRGKIHAKNVGDIDMYFVERDAPFPMESLAENIRLNEDKTASLN